MSRIIKGILVDVLHSKCQILEIRDELDEFYRILNCDTIDIVKRRIGRDGKQVTCDIVCNDEGFLVPEPISAVNTTFTDAIAGSIFIVGSSDGEHLVSLSDTDAKEVLRNIVLVNEKGQTHHVVTHCNY